MLVTSVDKTAQNPEQDFQRCVRVGREIEGERGECTGKGVDRNAGQDERRDARVLSGQEIERAQSDKGAGPRRRAVRPVRRDL